jgi:predicted TIM-barrel fold metal-dependent hydrolase
MTEVNNQQIRISADSHVSEPPDLWEKGLPAKYRDRALTFPNVRIGRGNHARPGGWDPVERLKDVAADGIAAEVLYPTLAKSIYEQVMAGGDIEVAKASDRVYNDWMLEFCQEAPERLWGQAHIGLWDMDYAIGELERTHRAGLKGVTVWVAPPQDLPWTSDHYERFWSACEEMGVPVAMHINSGFGSYVGRRGEREENPYATILRQAFGHKTVAMQAVAELILSGALERHPRLKLVLAEFECGWIPFYLEDLDRKFGRRKESNMTKLPSEYFMQSFYATFMEDGVGGFLLQQWGADNFLFANDYPHPGGIWPHTDDAIELTLNRVSEETRQKVLYQNVARVYGQPVPQPVARLQTTFKDEDAEWHRPWLKKRGEFTFNKSKMGLAV